MRKTFIALLWIALVVALSTYVLARLDRWEARHEEQQNYEGETATVLLIGYGGEQFPGIEQSGSYLRVGCEDMLVPMEIPVVSRRLESVLTALPSYEPPEGLHNPFREKGIIFREMRRDVQGKVTILLGGQPQFGGVCDTPRFKGQIEEIVRLYEKKFEIWLNGSESLYRCLDDLSGRCR